MYWKLVVKGDDLSFIDYKLPDNTIAVVAAPGIVMAIVLFNIYVKYNIIRKCPVEIAPENIVEATYEEFTAYLDTIQ